MCLQLNHENYMRASLREKHPITSDCYFMATETVLLDIGTFGSGFLQVRKVWMGPHAEMVLFYWRVLREPRLAFRSYCYNSGTSGLASVLTPYKVLHLSQVPSSWLSACLYSCDYHWLYVLSSLIAAPLADFAKPLIPWDNMRAAHPPGTTINLYISLNPHDDNALIDALYGAHLTKEQVAGLVRPHPDTLELVTSWLAHHGVRSSSISTTHGGGWLTVTNVLVSQANQMLGASYQLYRNAEVNHTIVRTVGYALPEVLHTHIQAVAPTTYFPSTRTLRQTQRRRSVGTAAALAEAETASEKPVTVVSSRAGEVRPAELRGLYKTFAYVPAAVDRNKLGVMGQNREYPSQADLTTPPSLATFTIEKVNGGGYDPDSPGVEANTDVHTGGIDRLSPDGDVASGDVYLEWLKYLLEKPGHPTDHHHIILVATSGIFHGNMRGPYASYLHSSAHVVSASSSLQATAASAPGTAGISQGNVRFVPEFPASCPYVTTVGGTTDYDPEVAAPISGGGFSDHFPRPVYQDVAVPAFLERQGTHSEGRGIPDYRRSGSQDPGRHQKRWIFSEGHELLHSVAGIISLLNDYLITNDRPPLGFLNFRLYGDGFAGLNDITSGSNPGCHTDGFSAVPGWDPVTGLGTPDFEKLQNIFMTPL
ncbi:subtilisin-like protein [Lactarius indigo]|nr:subtilisin-like protein [Lactarius indigo]